MEPDWNSLDAIDVEAIDVSVEPAEARKIRKRLSGAEIHRKLDSLLSRLDDEDLAEVGLSLLDIAPIQCEPFEGVSNRTLPRLLIFPETRFLTEQVVAMVRILRSLYCAVAEEEARRVSSHATDPSNSPE